MPWPHLLTITETSGSSTCSVSNPGMREVDLGAPREGWAIQSHPGRPPPPPPPPWLVDGAAMSFNSSDRSWPARRCGLCEGPEEKGRVWIKKNKPCLNGRRFPQTPDASFPTRALVSWIFCTFIASPGQRRLKPPGGLEEAIMENSSVGVTVPVTFKACLQEADREAAAHGRGNAVFGATWDPRPNPAFSLPCSPSPSGHFSSPPRGVHERLARHGFNHHPPSPAPV